MSLFERVSTRYTICSELTPAEATFSLAALESELVTYVKDDARHSSAFDIKSIPKVSRQQAAAEIAQSRPSALDSIQASSSKTPEPSPLPSSSAEAQSSYAAQLSAIPEFENYGPVLKSTSRPVELTESETEYGVTLVKHIFKDHVVFQFNVSNTIPDTALEQVTVLMTPGPETGLTEDFIIPIDSLTAASGSGQVYVSFTRDDPASYAAGSFACTLRFVSKEVDPASGEPEEEGYQDEYQVEDCDLGAGDVSDTQRSCSDHIVHHTDVCYLCKRMGQVGRCDCDYGDLCIVIIGIVTRWVVFLLLVVYEG
jgi:coatomer protein complex subunit gamma